MEDSSYYRMKTQNVPLSELKPAPYNPRRALNEREREALKNSIKKYKMVYPIVVNKRSGYIVGGHQRLEIMKEMGLKTAPVLYVDMDEEQEKRANVQLNAIEADWDVEKLQELLHPMTSEEVQELGWSKIEAEALLAGIFMNSDTKKALLEEARAMAGEHKAKDKDEDDEDEEEPQEPEYTCPKCGYKAPRHEFVEEE